MVRKRTLWIGLIIAVMLVAGGAYTYYRTIYLPSEEVSQPTITTADVRRGDLVISVSGSGTLLPSVESDLGFHSGGYVADVLVAVGDQVRSGDVLARLETDDLEQAILQADIKLRLANLNLADAQEGPSESERAFAEAAVESAQSALTVAQLAYNSAQNSDLDAAARARQIEFQYNVGRFYQEDETYQNGGNNESAVAEAWAAWSKSEAAFNEAVHEADLEQLEIANGLDQAKNRLRQAQEDLALLATGPATDTVLQAQLSVDQAELALADARDSLAGAELCAPFDGTVIDVTVVPGQHVGSDAVVTLADLQHPVLEFWVEEADMSEVAVGNRLEMTFEALPDLTFSGEVTRIDSALAQVGNTLALQAWGSLEVSSQDASLLGGMNADVEVISAEARDVLLVPVQALRQVSAGKYAVFVVRSDGELELRLVEVGLRDFVNAEVLSGLEEGEVVSTGVAQTTETVVQPDTTSVPGGPMGPGIGPVFEFRRGE
jgi:RND family efflux transporter MFP subunit